MKHLIVNYNNKLKRTHIVETVDFSDDDYILIHKIEVLERYVNMICPYVDIKKLITFNDRTKCLRYEKLIDDEIESINHEEGNVIDFS